MPRRKNISSIEKEIEKTEAELIRVQDKAEALAEKLLALRKQKQEYEVDQIANAYFKSGKSLSELMTFLQA